ncbi:phage tail tape measure protein [Clostridium sp. chh4-2]|nr:phage tail tape measure protein [Clostridium sp. chh4-2]
MTFKSAVSGLKSIATHAGSAAKTLGKAAVKGTVAGITAATVAVSGLGAAAVHVGAGFEASMSQVAATMGMTADEADYSNETYAKLANTAKEMGASTKFSASESAEALNYMALAGYDADKSCAALPTVLNLAASGGMELAAASDMVTDSMSALGIEATQENLTKFGDQLAKTAQKSNTSVAQLGEAVLTVGGTAKTLAGGTTELNTLLGIIADNGVKGAEGGTALRNIMLSLQAPTDTAAKKMKKLGLNVYDAEGKMRPMNDILNDLNSSMDGMTDQQKQDAISTIFNKNDLKSVNALLANSGARYDELSGYVNDSAGAMENMARTMNDNLTGKVTEFKSAAEGAGIAVYEALGSSNLKGLVSEATGWVTELTKATEKGGLEGLVGQLGTTLSKVLVTVTGYLPQLVQGGVSIVQSLLSGIMQNRDQIAQSVLNGLTTMLMGILQLAPQLLTAGILMLGSMLQGLDQQMPNILNAGLLAIQNLCAGLLANAPSIIQSGINIIMQLLNGLIAAAPTILTTGIQLVIMLAQGLIGAIPQLIQVIPQLVSAIITTLMSVNWLKLGLDIIKGIGNGLVQGIKGLFSKGKDAGKEVGDGVAAGLDESTSQLTAAADNTTADAAESLKPDTTLLSDYGMQMPAALASGIDSNSAMVEISSANLGTTALDSMNQAMASSMNGSQPVLTDLSTMFDGTMTDMNLSAATQMTQMDTTVQGSFAGMVTEAGEFSSDFKDQIDDTDLYQSGVDIMRGLDNGLNSMRGTVIGTAQGIATDVKTAVNSSLDIHSPSRVMEESGENTGLGLIKGMTNLTGKIAKTAQGIAGRVAGTMDPMRSRYSPESSTVTNSRNSNQTNNYSPVFNLTLNGASASDSNERKIKRWVKDAMKEAMDGMGRTNPPLQEV